VTERRLIAQTFYKHGHIYDKIIIIITIVPVVCPTAVLPMAVLCDVKYQFPCTTVTTLSQHCHNTVATLSQHCRNTHNTVATTLSQHCRNPVATLSQHCRNTVATLSQQCHDTVATLSQHYHNPVATLSQHSQHCHNTVATLSPYLKYITLFHCSLKTDADISFVRRM